MLRYCYIWDGSNMGSPRLGKCLCGAEATIRDTKAEDGRLHFVCHQLTDDGKARHYGFVDRSEVGLVEANSEDSDRYDKDGWG